MARSRLLPFLIALLAPALLAPSAGATTLLKTSATASSAKLRACHARLLPAGATVRRFETRAAETGLLLARTTAASRSGDWDVAVFGRDGRFVAAAASPDSEEIASGFVTEGEPLTVQACLVRGGRSRVRIGVEGRALPLSGGHKVQILSVDVPTRAARNRLIAMGFDDAHSHSPTTLDIVVSDPEDYERLRAAGYTWTVEAEDLAARELERARLDRAYAARVRRSALPSGRTEYRHLADYESELKQLATKHPGLVKLVTLNHKSLEGREIVGVEIAQNVNVNDGRPVFLQLGVHHAREWPAGEHPMEWAYELVNGYGKDDRATNLVNATRTIVVPITNPDGFNLSREAPVDAGNALAMVDLPPDVDSQLPVSDPTYIAAILADQLAGTFAYKRRNCRVTDGQAPAPGECGNPDNRNLGVDTNRNYGQFWGGPGASLDPGSDTYRGAGPFSEPETQAVRELISSHQVTTLITNHTFSNLILRAPGIKTEGLSPDEAAMKALGDAMAANNGYTSQYGWELYDTTGTTEDWSYTATGGYGYTFEIGPDEFHPPFEEMVAEYEGAGEYAGKGNRAAYFLAQENTADAEHHSILRGTAPPGTVLRVHKEFMSTTSPVIKEDNTTGDPMLFRDVLDSTMTVGAGGRFEWHVNPSTRPYVRKERVYSDVAAKPAFEEDISSPTPVLPGIAREIEFEVKPDAARQIVAAMTSEGPDYDMYLYEGSVAPENQVGSSADGDANETIVLNFPKPGKYVLEIVNYSAIAPYDGKIQVFGEAEGTRTVTPAHTEAWTFTCERPDGSVIATRKVEVDRGKVADLGAVCRTSQGTAGALEFRLSVKGRKRLRSRRVAARGLSAVARCSRACTLNATVKLGRRVIARTRRPVSFTGKRTLRLRLNKRGRALVRKRRSSRLVLTAVARDRLGNVKSRTVRVRVRR